jgi:hypothetical protein
MSCLDCSSYHGTTGACGSSQCTCEANSALACGANVPTCGIWNFNGGSVEGWRYGHYYPDDDHHWKGNLTTTQINGSRALSGEYEGSSEGGSLELEVDLCPSTAILNLSNYKLSYDYYFLTTGGTPFSQVEQDGNDSFMTSGGKVILGCQPFSEPGSDTWITGECSNLPNSLTTLNLIFRIGAGWSGKIFIDNVRFTPK